MTRRRVIIWLLVCLVLKMGQEWTLHGGQYLENYVAVDLVEDWWNWLTSQG
jgi:hypothetical protein